MFQSGLSRVSLALLLVISFFTADVVAQTQLVPKAPTGWTKRTVSGKKGHTSYTKTGFKSPNYLVVKYYAHDVLVDQENLGLWIQKRLIDGKAPLTGQWSGPINKLTRLTRNLYTAERKFKVDGKVHLIKVMATCVDKLHVRMTATIMSQNRETRKHETAAIQIQSQILKLEIEAAKTDDRGLDIERTPPKVKDLKLSQPIKPGLYVGTTVSKRNGESGNRYDLVLFETGEYQFLNRKRDDKGQYTYSVANGRLEIDDPFENDPRDWDDVCVYGKNKNGENIIHAESKYWLTQLKWIKESKLLPPREALRQKEIAEQEAKRFKHLTEPGKGVKADEIEAVLYSRNSVFRSGALQLDFEGFLLLKDGRVHDGLPCSPDVLDLAASRSREPDAWGWWKKLKDDEKNRFTFAWPVRPREYRIPNGKQYLGVPFKKGTRLTGDFGLARSKQNIATGYSSVQESGIKLNKNGRFLKYKRGSVQSGGVPGMNTLITNVWDDEGAVMSVTGPVVVGGTRTKNNNPGLDRMGKYEFDGYRLTLKFDSGRVEHVATFTDQKQSFVWFEGRTLFRKKD